MIRTYREIKSSLDLSREKKIVCRTSQIESSVRREIEGKYGDLSRFAEDVALKEKMRRHKQSLSLEKSRLNLFITKEKLSHLQQVRLNQLDPKRLPSKQDDPPEKASRVNDETPHFRRVELKY